MAVNQHEATETLTYNFNFLMVTESGKVTISEKQIIYE